VRLKPSKACSISFLALKSFFMLGLYSANGLHGASGWRLALQA
jgi:hypothetical protein